MIANWNYLLSNKWYKAKKVIIKTIRLALIMFLFFIVACRQEKVQEQMAGGTLFPIPGLTPTPKR